MTMPASLRHDLSLDQIVADLRSTDQMTRGHALQDLLRQVKRNPEIHGAALEIFRQYIPTATDPWTATTAASGIEHIVGVIDARSTWLSLLNSPDDTMAAGTAMVMTDAFYVPA